jgi:guanosine-3',5'-bis(diphosphate) 3'-pyrophosphohydrolase
MMPVGARANGSGWLPGREVPIAAARLGLTREARGRITRPRGIAIDNVSSLLRALDFAADRHRNQRRKDRRGSPYINHLIAVADLLANTGGVADPVVLAAGVLHDTVEDVGVTLGELEARFGAEVRGIVAEVTDDKTLPKAVRKQRQVEHAANLSVRAKLVKLADKIANLRDVIDRPPALWPRQQREEYLSWSAAVVAGCRGTNDALERMFDDEAARGRAQFGSRKS